MVRLKGTIDAGCLLNGASLPMMTCLAAPVSGEASRPRGGRISTRETNAPVASFEPRLLLEETGSFSIGFGVASVSTMTGVRCTGRVPATASRISLICSGVVRQQPPTIVAPACTKRLAEEAIYSGEN